MRWPWIPGVLLSVVAAGAAELQPCKEGFDPGDRAECGTVRVLEDRSKPDGRTIELAVVVLRAAAPDGRAPLFILAGGPGQGARDLAGLALGPFSPVREHRDVVLVDQRGTGGSNPLPCATNAAADPQAAFGNLFDPIRIAACRDEALRHADPRLYGTLPVVSDLDEVREHLGYERVVLWGGSGGTRTALVWLREHPDRVEAAVLDGVTPTNFLAPSGYARSCQQALDRVFADCEAQADCKAAYPDLRGDFARLLALFAAGPVETWVTKPNGERAAVRMHGPDFGYAVRGILYNSGAIARLPKMIHAAAATNDVSAFAQLHWERHVAIQQGVAIGVHLSVFGTEDVPFIDPQAVPELVAGTFFGTYLIDQYTAACRAWEGRGALPEGYHAPVRAATPVLLLSGYYDPTTPSAVAAEVARHLSRSRHVVVRDEAHGAGFGCALQLVLDFLERGSLADLGPACEDAGPIVFEAR